MNKFEGFDLRSTVRVDVKKPKPSKIGGTLKLKVERPDLRASTGFTLCMFWFCTHTRLSSSKGIISRVLVIGKKISSVLGTLIK